MTASMSAGRDETLTAADEPKPLREWRPWLSRAPDAAPRRNVVGCARLRSTRGPDVKRLRIVLAGTALVATTLACAPPPIAGTELDGGAVDPVTDPICRAVSAKQVPPAPITNGRLTPTAVALNEGQQLAVGAILRSFGDGLSNSCTATLVTPDVVVTAAHCVWGHRGPTSPSRVRFGIGPDMAVPMHALSVAAIHVHPAYAEQRGDARYDIALLKLTAPATAVMPSLVPIPINREPLGATLVGAQIQAVGYGMTDPEDGSNTRKFWTTEEVVGVTAIDIVVDGKGRSAVCFGDSGGPLLHVSADGLVRVHGILSWGDPTCLDRDHFGRVDTHLAWLESPEVGGPLDEGPCGEISDSGLCDGTFARRCESGRRVSTDCADTGERCGPGSDGHVGCVPDPCAGITFAGSCVGDVAYWCQGDEVHSFDCGRCGWGCGDTGATLGMYCMRR